MISLKYADIPTYLHESSFYKTLDDEEQDGEIEIPERCYSWEDRVDNEEDFVQLLRVTSFWGLSKIPLSMILFCSSGAQSWAAQINKEHSKLPIALDLLHIFTAFPLGKRKSNRRDSLVRAIKRGRVEIVEYLAPIRACGTEAISAAAEVGQLECLQILHRNGHVWDSSACTLATTGGHLDCLRYLHENGCPWSIPDMHSVVTRYNQLPCLKYMIEQGVPWDNLSNFIATYGNLDMLKYAVENGCTFTNSASEAAAQHGHVECLRYLLYEVKSPASPDALLKACRHGQLACVQLLHEYDAAWTVDACTAAISSGSLSCLKYVHESGCPWNMFTSIVAARSGDFDMLYYLLSNGCPYCTQILEHVISSVAEGALQCFKYLTEDVPIEKQVVMNKMFKESLLSEAFARGNYYIVQYLFERDPACKSHTIIWPSAREWYLHKLDVENRTSVLAELDANVVKSIKCALESGWNIDTCGDSVARFIVAEKVLLPLSYKYLKPYFAKGLGNRKRKKMA